MSLKQIIGLIGASLLILGVFLPILHLPTGSLTYFGHGKGDGLIVLILSFFSIYSSIKEKYSSVRFYGFTSALILTYTLYNLLDRINSMKNKLDADLDGNPFKGLANIVVANVYIDWGFGILALGTLLIIVSSYLREKELIQDLEIQKKYNNHQPHSVKNENKKSTYMHKNPIKDVNDKEEQKIPKDNNSSTKTNKYSKKANLKKPISSEMFDKKKSFIKKNIIYITFIILLTIIAYSLFHRTNDEEKITVVQKETSSNSYDDQMGWGKAPSDINIELADISVGKYSYEYNDYKHPVPVIKLSVKNNGLKELQSFGINFKVNDIDNKRKILSTAQASGNIKPGWTSGIESFWVDPRTMLNVIPSGEAIDFNLSIKIYVLTVDGREIMLYDDVLSPSQLNNLSKMDI